MRDTKDLQTYWYAHAGDELMLCTIVRKNGSGYRAAGAKKIIRKDGSSCGYLSGGCLEGDIVRCALEQWTSAPFLRAFSTMSEEDRLLGYQTGCAGVLEILFEHLPADISLMREYLPYGKKENIEAISISLQSDTLSRRTLLNNPGEKDDNVFIDSWVEPVALYVLGCGPNARPFAEMAPALGWDVTFLDYRQGNIMEERVDITSSILPMADITKDIPENPRTAVVVMTHNYEADMSIVGQLNGKSFGYIGCVGPRKRFEQMRIDLKQFHDIHLDETWMQHVHAPAGLKQGRSPEDIAFSIIAEIQFGLTP